MTWITDLGTNFMFMWQFNYNAFSLLTLVKYTYTFFGNYISLRSTFEHQLTIQSLKLF